MLRARARPSPVPPGLLLTLRSKIRGTRSAGTPRPESLTSITTDLGVSEVRIPTVPAPCTSALSSSVAINWDSVPGVMWPVRFFSPATSSLRFLRRNAGSHSTTCWATTSSTDTRAGLRAAARLVRPSNWLTTSVSRSVASSAATPSSRTTSGSSAAASIPSSRMDSAVSGVRS